MNWEFDTSYAVVNGFNHDNRAALQNAINTATANGNGLYITGQYGLQFDDNNSALVVPSNAHIKFLPGAALKLLPHNLTTYHVFLLDTVSGVTIENAVIDGSKEVNSAATDQNSDFGMGISMYDADTTVIIDPVIRNTWGDGIYIGGTLSTNVDIWNPYIAGVRRNGISVISAQNLNIHKPVFENIVEMNPKSGIDFEPNTNNNDLININVYSPRTIGCNLGLNFYMGSLPGPTPKAVSINVYDYKSSHDNDTSLTFQDLTKGTYTVSGTIKVHNVRYVKPNITKAILNWDNSIVLSVTGETTIS